MNIDPTIVTHQLNAEQMRLLLRRERYGHDFAIHLETPAEKEIIALLMTAMEVKLKTAKQEEERELLAKANMPVSSPTSVLAIHQMD